MKIINRSWIAFAPVILSLATFTDEVSAQAPATLDAIEKAWQERQDRVWSFTVEWTATWFITKGTFSERLSGLPAAFRAKNDGKILPSEDETHDKWGRLCVDGDKMRYEHDGLIWSATKAALIRRPYVSTFDGKVGRNFFAPPEDGSSTHGNGIVTGKAHHSDIKLMDLTPVLMTFRANHPQMRSYAIRDLALTGRSRLIDNRKCIELLEKSPRSTYRASIWVDLGREFVVVRKESGDGKTMTLKTEMQYSPHAIAGWALSGWSNTHYDKTGKLIEAYKFSPSKFEINAVIPPSEFSADFPAGSFVQQNESNTMSMHLIRPDGSKREINIREEYNKSYEELLATNPARSRAWRLTGLGAASALVFALSALIYRRHRRHRENSSPPTG